MYQKVGIKKLSNAQISKLLNGHRIRVSQGDDHEIYASSEQHKKINKVVNKIKNKEIPSTPIVKFKFKLEIHINFEVY